MIQSRPYQMFFFSALILHGMVALLLLWDNTSNERPAMTLEAKNTTAPSAQAPEPQQQAIQAVSVDSHEVMAAVNELKAERQRTALAEKNRQLALASQAEAARRKRVEEQQKFERLKAESAKMALAQKKRLAEEQQHLQQLAKQKEAEKQQLEALQNQQRDIQKQQKEEEKTLAALRTKTTEEHARETQANAARAAEALAKQQQIVKQQQAAAMQQASQEAADKTRIAGVVDKYKALIIHAISQQWILPDHADSRLSSQFRIRLAPNGAVLEVSLTRSSGDPILDRSAQSAIYKASPLPVPSESDMFNLFRDISLTVRPENAQG